MTQPEHERGRPAGPDGQQTTATRSTDTIPPDGVGADQIVAQLAEITWQLRAIKNALNALCERAW